MENPRERESAYLGFRVFQRVRWEPLSAPVETRGERTKVTSYFLFLDQFFIFFWYEKRKKNLLGGDGGHIRFHRPSQIVWRKRKKKTNYNRNSKLKACKFADLETWISTLVQSEGTNQPKENNREKKMKENFVYLYTSWIRQSSN